MVEWIVLKDLKHLSHPLALQLICTVVCLSCSPAFWVKYIAHLHILTSPKKEYPMNACIYRIIQTINIRKNDVTTNNY